MVSLKIPKNNSRNSRSPFSYSEDYIGSHYAPLWSPLQPPSQHKPPGALAHEEATSHATSESFLRAMQQQLRRPAVHRRSHSCTERHMWTRESIVMWRGNMVVMWGMWMWCEKATLLSFEKDTSLFSGRVTFPSCNREKVKFTVMGWVYLILDWLRIRYQASGIRDQGWGIRKLWTVNCEMGTENWELQNGNWKLGTGN